MTKKNKNKILFILKLSKKLQTGFHSTNQYVFDSQSIRENFNSKFILLFSNSTDNVFLNRLVIVFKMFLNSLKIIWTLTYFRPVLVYFTISPVNAFFRDLVYVLILRLYNSKIVYHLNGKGIKDKATESSIANFFYKWAYNEVCIIVVSTKLLYDMDFLPYKNSYIVPNAAEKVNNELLQKNTRRDDILNVVFLSNLIISKGVLDFIDSIKILLDEGILVRSIIIGGEVELRENEVKDIINVYNDSIHYLGPKFHDEKYRILADSDIFVFPTFYSPEAMPLAILEAMQSSLPVITTDEGATTDMVKDGINGFIVEKNNPLQISEKVKLLKDNPELRKKMGEAGRDIFLNNFTMDKFQGNLVNTLNQILMNK